MNIKRKIFDFIIDQATLWKSTPSCDEVYKAFSGICDDVDVHLRQLQNEGLLTLAVTGEITVPQIFAPNHASRIKMRDSISKTGSRSGSNEHAGSILLDLREIGVVMPATTKGFQVLDESMVDAGIEHGDIVITEDRVPVRGDVVVVEIDKRTVLRRYLVIAKIPHLLAENPIRPDLCVAWNFPVHGVLWGLIRTKPCRSSATRKISYSQMGELLRQNVPAAFSRSAVLKSDNRAKKRVSNPVGVHSKSPRRAKREKTKTQPRSETEIQIPGDWPSPPSGFELNDGTDLGYRADEQPS